MEKTTKWNKELLYSFIFFVLATLTFIFLYGMRMLSDYISLSLDLKYRLLILGIPGNFDWEGYVALTLFLFLIGLSIYKGIQSLKKSVIVTDNGVKVSSIPHFLALLQVCTSIFALIYAIAIQAMIIGWITV